MCRKLVLFIFLFCNITACSSLHNKGHTGVPQNLGFNDISNKLSESYDGSVGNRLVAFPFFAVGGLMVGAGGLFLYASDSESSEVDSQSKAQVGLLGLGLLAGGALLWNIGNSIEE